LRADQDGIWRVDLLHRVPLSPTELAPALEERDFDSLWVAEHSQIPVTRRFLPPGTGGELGRQYYDVMDPFVTLSVAAPS